MASPFERIARSQLQRLKANPIEFLTGNNINVDKTCNTPQSMIESMTGQKIPEEYANNPQGYFNYLMSNTQMTEQQHNNIMRTAKIFNFQ